MKLMYNGKMVEFNTNLEKGEKELDMLEESDVKVPNENINMEDTIEISEEELISIKNGENGDNK